MATPSLSAQAAGAAANSADTPPPRPTTWAVVLATTAALTVTALFALLLLLPATAARVQDALLPPHVSPQAVGFAAAAVLVAAWLQIIAPPPAHPARKTGLPRPPRAGLPLVGDTFKALADAKAVRDARHAQLGDVFSAYFMGVRYTSVRGAKLVKSILQAEHVTVETEWPWRVRELLGPHSISTTQFAAHTALRKALAPAFGPAAVAGYVPLMQRVCEEHVRAWAGAGPGLPGAAASKAFTFHVITHVLGFHDGAHWSGPAARSRANALFADWLGGFHPLGSGLPGGKLWKARRARAALLAMIRETLVPMVAARAGSPGGGQGKDAPSHVMDRVVDALLAEPGASPASILAPAADIALNLLFAGTDTSSTVLTLLLRSLAADPGLTSRLRAEQAAVVAQHGPALSSAALDAMPLLAAAMKEQLRVTPIVGQVFRSVVVDAVDVGGYEVRKGETLVLDLAHTMEADARWAGEDGASPAAPSKFYPDRWIAGSPGAPADEEALKKFFSTPFGGGPRMCVGYILALAEVKTMMSVILRSVAWAVAAPHTELMKPPNGLPLPVDGFLVHFTHLSDKNVTDTQSPGGEPEQ